MLRMILTDLDGTLLHSDKTLSGYTESVLRKCRDAGLLIAFATARGESNALTHIERIRPDFVISSGGALVRQGREIVASCVFSSSETRALIDAAFRLTGGCDATVDALDGYYANYREEVSNWGDVIRTDFADFNREGLKVCFRLQDDALAARIAEAVEVCDWLRFSGTDWYKFTKPGGTKENAVRALSEHTAIPVSDMIAFGDDFTDIGMLKLCGTGIAVSNAIPEVLQIADAVCASNDEDGVAHYLEALL